MLNTIAKLFGRSPFAPLQAHMEKVTSCIQLLPQLMEAVARKDMGRIKEISKQMSRLEHAADLAKNDIRNHLPQSLFLPVDRQSLLDILAIQDSIADQAEDIGILLTFKEISVPEGLEDELKEFCHKNIETFELAHQIILELPELLESSFGGKEAEKVRNMVDRVASEEHAVDTLQREIVTKLFTYSETMHYSEFFLWIRLVEHVAEISNRAEKLANRIRMTLELK